MAKYELADKEVQEIINILGNATVRVVDAPRVMQLIRLLQRPTPEPKKEEKK